MDSLRRRQRLVAALDDFGMGSVGLEPADFLEPEIVVQLGYPPYRIDLITSVGDVNFDSCWDRRLTISVGSVEAGLISCDDLIANKQGSGRPQDTVDVGILTQLRPKE